MSIANLVVSLEANIAKFSDDMQRASEQTTRTMSSIQSGAQLATRALGALGVAFSASAVLGWAKDVVASASALDDLADSTGSSVENLSRLANQATISGVEFGTLQGLVLKLAAGMAGVEEESSKVGKALAAIGVTAKDPAEALNEIAMKLNEYADGTAKAALARDLFGKGGPAFLAMLKDMANAHGVAATVTKEQAAEAEKLEQGLRRLGVEATTFKTILLSSVVPVLNDTIDRFRQARTDGNSLWQSWILSGTVTSNLADQLGRASAKVADIQQNIDLLRKNKDNPYFNTALLTDWEDKLTSATAKLRTLQSIMAGMMQGENGDKWDRFLTGKQGMPAGGQKTLDYSGSAGGGAKGANDYAAALQKVAEAAAVASLELDGVFSTDKIVASQRALATLMASDTWGKFTKQQQIALMVEYDSVIAIEKETAALKQQLAAVITAIEADEKQAEAKQKLIDARVALLLDYEAANERMAREIEIIGQGDLARQKLVATIEYETLKKKLLLEQDELGLAKLDEEYEKRQRLIEQSVQKTGLNESLKKQEADWKRTYDNISGTITDALMRGFENGKSWAVNFRETLINMFKTLILRPTIQALVGPVAGSVSSLFSGNASAAGGGGMGSVGDIFSMFSNAGSMASTAATGISSIFGASSFTAGLAGDAFLPGMLAAGEGAIGMATLGASLAPLMAALPWVALAAIAVPLIISAFDKGPAERTANFGSNAGLGSGNSLFQSKSAFGTFGLSGDKWFSNEEMAAPIQAMLKTISGLDNAIAGMVGADKTAAITAALQGSKGFSFGTEHTDLNASGVVGSILKDRYMTVLDALDSRLGAVLDQFEGVGDEMAQFVLALVQLQAATEKLPKQIAGDLINALDGTAATVERIGAIASAYATLQDAMNADPMEDAFKAIAAQTRGTYESFIAAGVALQELGSKFDGSADSAKALATATGQYYQMQVQLLAQLEQVRQSLSGSGGSIEQTVRGIRMSTLDSSGQYAFLQAETERLRAELSTATNPQDIARLVSAIEANVNQAFGLLSPEEQKAQAQAFIDNLRSFGAEADARIRALQEQTKKEAGENLDNLRTVLTEHIAGLAATAATNAAAANTNLIAANTPLEIKLDLTTTNGVNG